MQLLTECDHRQGSTFNNLIIQICLGVFFYHKLAFLHPQAVYLAKTGLVG